MADGTFVSWLAMDGEQVIATSGMSFVERPPHFGCPSGKLGILSSMFTHPNYRRRGIAKELLSRVVAEAENYKFSCSVQELGIFFYQAFRKCTGEINNVLIFDKI